MKIPYGFLCALLGSSILIACGGSGSGGGSSSASDSTKPTIISTTPAQGATNVPINTPITVTFSEPMNPATITNATFYLTANGGIYPGTVIYTGTTAIFTPNTFPLAYAGNYTATISTGAKDLAGNSLVANNVWVFSTATGIPSSHQVTISWTANREAAVNATGGGYKINISGQPFIDVPYTAPTNKIVTLLSGNYTATITAYSALNPSTGLPGTSTSMPSSTFAIIVPY